MKKIRKFGFFTSVLITTMSTATAATHYKRDCHFINNEVQCRITCGQGDNAGKTIDCKRGEQPGQCAERFCTESGISYSPYDSLSENFNSEIKNLAVAGSELIIQVEVNGKTYFGFLDEQSQNGWTYPKKVDTSFMRLTTLQIERVS